MPRDNPADPVSALSGREHVPLLTPAASAAADRRAIGELGVPEAVLMENAGRAAALVANRLHPHGTVVGVAGAGNNGGDLLVMLRTLRSWGRDVALIQAGSRAPDTRLGHGFDVPALEADAAEAALLQAGLIVDGILGTGSEGVPRGPAAEWIERMNGSGRPVMALDLPSGADAETGRVHEPAVRATVTVCFGWPKLGLMLHPAREHCGRMLAVEIGFPPAVQQADAAVVTPAWARARIRPRPPVSHKSAAGRLLIHAGSAGMAGAAALAAEAAFRAGVGLVRIASPAANREVLQLAAREATFLDVDDLDGSDVATMHALVAGPGLGTSEEARRALASVLERTAGRPTLLDADALNILAGDAGSIAALAQRRPLVITPHAAELGRLTGTEIADILASPPAAARAAAERFGCTVLLKGTPSMTATPNGTLLVNSTGSSDSAVAGMGDQLAGVIGAFLAAGREPAEAAALALFLCGRAADMAATGPGLMPRDVTAAFPAAVRDPGSAESGLGLPFVTFDQPPRR